MKIKKIEISLGRTINLGNFESARIDIRMAADLEDRDGDDINKVYDDLMAEVEDKLSAEVDVITPHGINIPPSGY